MAELMGEDKKKVDKEVDMGEGSSTRDLVHQQVLMLWVTMPAAPRFWAAGPSEQVAKRGPATSSTASGKVPTV